jgi:hypothetical protein
MVRLLPEVSRRVPRERRSRRWSSALRVSVGDAPDQPTAEAPSERDTCGLVTHHVENHESRENGLWIIPWEICVDNT